MVLMFGEKARCEDMRLIDASVDWGEAAQARCLEVRDDEEDGGGRGKASRQLYQKAWKVAQSREYDEEIPLS